MKLKEIIKYAVIAYIVYLFYHMPQKDWLKGIVLTEELESGNTTRYVPQQTAYYKYAMLWWKMKFQSKKLSGLIDEYILEPVGIETDNLDSVEDDEDQKQTNTPSPNLTYNERAGEYGIYYGQRDRSENSSSGRNGGRSGGTSGGFIRNPR